MRCEFHAQSRDGATHLYQLAGYQELLATSRIGGGLRVLSLVFSILLLLIMLSTADKCVFWKLSYEELYPVPV